MGTLVFDIDDTICVHKNRDYANAKPIKEVIDKINTLYEKGYEIILYTSRGMASCKGDLDLIISRNKEVLEKWLKNNNVSYTKLIFGKPLGDWYIDDKAMTINQFIEAPFYEIKGGSNASIKREGDRIIKTSSSSKMQYSWFNSLSNSDVKIPKLYGITLDTLYMEYIEEDKTTYPISSIYSTIIKIKNIEQDIFSINCNLDKYCTNILNHIDEQWTRELCSKILENKSEFDCRKSFCHGDITLSNCLFNKDGVYIIDPNYKDDYNSYLIDLSKLRMSLNGFELNLGRWKNNRQEIDKKNYCDISLSELDKLIGEKDIYLVKLLEVANWVRLHNFRKGKEQEYAYKRAKELWEEIRR